MMFSNVAFLTVKSIGSAALDATIKPGTLQPWVNEIESKVATSGKFSKLSVAYLPFSPPPVFWDYKCRKCRWWEVRGACKTVEGEISPQGWCAIWIAPPTYKALTWPQELLRGDW